MNKINETNEVEINDEFLDSLSEEEFQEIVASLTPQKEITSGDDLVKDFDSLEMDDEELTELVNLEEFIKGKSIGAKLAGMYTVLVNSGIPIKTSGDLIVNQMTLEHNFNLQLEMNKTSIEVAKYQGLMTKQQTL